MEHFKVTFYNAQPVAETSNKVEQKPLALWKISNRSNHLTNR